MGINELSESFGIFIVIIVIIGSLLSTFKKKTSSTVYKKAVSDYNESKSAAANSDTEKPPAKRPPKLFIDYVNTSRATAAKNVSETLSREGDDGEVNRSRDGRMLPTEHKQMTARTGTDSMGGAASDTEGGDPCHAYMLPDEQSDDYADAYSNAPSSSANASQLVFTKDSLLQGVIFSEILTRPALRKKPGTLR